jgi:CHAT domain-containing protein
MRSNLFFILFWLSVLFSVKALSQNSYKEYKQLLDENKKLLIDSKIDSLLLLSEKDSAFKIAAEIAHYYSLKLYKRKEYSRAIKYTLTELEYLDKTESPEARYLSAIYNIGIFYLINEEFDNSIKFYEKIIERNSDENRVGRAYCQIARCYEKKNQLFKAIAYYDKGLSILENQKNYKRLITQYINLAIVYKDVGTKESLKKSLLTLNKASSLSIFNKISNRDFFTLNTGYANYYFNDLSYDFEKAKFYYKKNITRGLFEKNTKFTAINYNNLGELYIKEKKDSAIYFIDKGIEFFKEDRFKLEANTAKSLYHYYKKNYDKALNSMQLALSFNTGVSINWDSTPSFLSLINSINKGKIIFALKLKAQILNDLFLIEKNKEYLKTTINSIKAIDVLVNYIQHSNSENKTKLHWRKEASKAYLLGMQAALLLNKNETIFYFMERNKALLLTESIAENIQQASLPKNISKKNNYLKKEVLKLENKTKNRNDNFLRDSLFSAKLVFEKYRDSIKEIYPNSFIREGIIEQVSLLDVKETLSENQVLVSYAWNFLDEEKEILIGLATSKNKTFTFEVTDIQDLKERLKKYRAFISKPLTTQEEQYAFQEVSFDLYQQLFPSVEIRNLIKGKELTIIPDGNLQSIPFEALITKENTQEYLINSNNINYTYSMSFLEHNNSVNRTTKNNFIGYSPINFKVGLESLKNTEKEVNNIQQIVDGTAQLNDAASKEHFLEHSNTSKIIHLATHADASSNPWIAFSDEKLELHELYTYKNNADLVVLSACNTSLGEVAVGEGILSLARGFFYSGANSVVSSLWNVNDKATSTIMTDFYTNLKSGETKSVALNKAKRTYLKTHSLSEQSPYYWSSFVLIGNTDAIDLSNNTFLYLAVFLVLIGLGYFISKKYKK